MAGPPDGAWLVQQVVDPAEELFGAVECGGADVGNQGVLFPHEDCGGLVVTELAASDVVGAEVRLDLPDDPGIVLVEVGEGDRGGQVPCDRRC